STSLYPTYIDHRDLHSFPTRRSSDLGYDPGVIHGTVHTADFNHLKNTQVGKQKLVEDFDQNFHLYAINWTENTIEFYIDGNKYQDRKSTRLNSSHVKISYAVFCLKKK